jgi:hypothetical protein
MQTAEPTSFLAMPLGLAEPDPPVSRDKSQETNIANSSPRLKPVHLQEQQKSVLRVKRQKYASTP